MYDQIVKPQTLVLDTAPCNDGQGTFSKLPISYEEYGAPKTREGEDKPVVAILPFFLGSAHAAGHRSVKDNKRVAPGYWDALMGSDAPINTDTHRVISFEPLINDHFHPGLINPATRKPYGGAFPNFTLADVSQIQRLALKQLGVGHVNVLMGASMGSLQAWHFMAHEPSYVSSMVLVVPGGLELSQKTRTLTEQWVQKLEQDPDWHGGDYGSLAKDKQPKKALVEVLSDFWYRVQFPVDHSLLYDLNDIECAEVAVAHHALDANDVKTIDTVLASLNASDPRVKLYKQTLTGLCAKTDHNVLLWQLRSVLSYQPQAALQKSTPFIRHLQGIDDRTDVAHEMLATTRILMIATEADDLLDIGSVDRVMGMAAWIGFDAMALRMPATFTHAAGLNAASPDSILAFKSAIAQFLKPPSKL
ncbi:MAG: alpha/beta fold hydrolase [Hydrogenophaga sp.]|uniref:alpha/beta fold hydrolase n=1 Tax=Hydrogenophaga sp. TaxID=1904254 RepID=UPI002ABC3159|nr:alpha/beta fold hydrolase [Hydrogenophaga sp.]MDZ4280733.1 alpha/beta fold hydrolase [Hydrogenophaga sp.]